MGVAVSLCMSIASCKDEDFTETIFDTTEYPLDRSSYTFPLDTFVKKNFLEPYNLRYLYKMQDIGSNMDYNLIPCSYDQSITLAVLCKYLWYDVYKKTVGEEFLKQYSPRIIHVIGSPAYNPTSGTILLGTAEGGLKITLYNAESLSPSDIDYMNEYFFKTMHHEFSHILNQNFIRPVDFDKISNGKYNAVDWQNTPDSVALGQGFISPYSSEQAREDWVEIIANYIVKDTVTWSRQLNTASYSWEDAKDVDATHFRRIWQQYRSGRANIDSIGYPIVGRGQDINNSDNWEVSATSGGNPATYRIQRKLIERDSAGYAIPGPNGEIQYKKSSGVNGRDVILQKLKYTRDWLKEYFDYDLEAVRMEVQRRQWLTDDDGNFIFDANGNFINRLTYQRPDGKALIDDLRQEVENYKALQTK